MKKNKALAPQAADRLDRDLRTENEFHEWMGCLPWWSFQAAKRYWEVAASNRTPEQRDEMARILGMTPENYAKVLAGDYDACFVQWEQDEHTYEWQGFKCPSYEVAEIKFKVKAYLDALERLDAAEAKKKKKKAA